MASQLVSMSGEVQENCTVYNADNSVYKYQSINSENNEIRIAEILPASDTKRQIHCRLRHVSLDSPPAYKALSYTWGTATDSASIILDGKVARVTTNLEAALRRLRARNEIITIWVDFICINQIDLDERSAQAAKMKYVYRKAEAVYVWLGKADDYSILAWQLVHDLMDISDETAVQRLCEGQFQYNKFQALKQLFRRPYWWRIWVVQEVTCGQEVTVHCGEESISWVALSSICDRLERIKEYLKSVYPNDPTSIHSLLAGGPKGLRLTRFSMNMQPPLLELLYSHASKDSTDPRDKVYALVGISSSQYSFGALDYSRSLVDTYAHTVRHIITTTHSLDAICFNQNDNNLYGLPTWVPDWERRNKYPKHRVMGLHIRIPHFHAAGASSAEVSFLNNGHVIKAKGFELDSIGITGKSCYLVGHQNLDDKIIQALETFQDWWNIFQSVKASNTSSQEEFRRTLCGGAWAPAYELYPSQRLRVFFSLSEKLLPLSPLEIPVFEKDDSLQSEEDQRDMVSAASLRMHGKRLVISLTDHWTCLAPLDAKEGDRICVLLGCKYPVILRRVEQHYLLIGEVYVDGIMDGELMGSLEAGRYKLEDFEIR